MWPDFKDPLTKQQFAAALKREKARAWFEGYQEALHDNLLRRQASKNPYSESAYQVECSCPHIEGWDLNRHGATDPSCPLHRSFEDSEK